MAEGSTDMSVRALSNAASVIDIRGEVTGAAEDPLMDAYNTASSDSTRAIILNFSELEYLNSSGIGLLVTLLVRARRQGQSLLAYGLSDHYREIFQLTRLDEAVRIHDDENAALADAGVR